MEGDDGFWAVIDELILTGVLQSRCEFLDWALGDQPERRLGHKLVSIWLVKRHLVPDIAFGKKVYEEIV